MANIIGHITRYEDDILIGDKLSLKMKRGRSGEINIVTWMQFSNGAWHDFDRVETTERTLIAYLLKEVEKIHCPQCGEEPPKQLCECVKGDLL